MHLLQALPGFLLRRNPAEVCPAGAAGIGRSLFSKRQGPGSLQAIMPGAAVDRQAQVDAIVEAAILPSKELTLEQEVFNRIDRDAQVGRLASWEPALKTDAGFIQKASHDAHQHGPPPQTPNPPL